MTFSPDSKTVVAGLGGSPGTREHGKGGVVLLDADTGKSQLKDPLLVDQGDVLSVVYSPDGKTIAAGFGGPDSISSGRPGGVVFWDADTPHQSRARQLDVKEGEVVNVDYSNDGRTIATAYHVLKPLGGLEGRGGVVLWDADSGRRKMSPLLVPEGDVTDAAFSSDGKALVVGYHVIDPHHSNNPIGGVVLLDVTTGHRRENTPLHVNEGGVTCLAFRPHENMIAVGFRGSVLFYDSEKTQRLIEVLFTLKEGQIGSVACSPEPRRSQRHIAASTNWAPEWSCGRKIPQIASIREHSTLTQTVSLTSFSFQTARLLRVVTSREASPASSCGTWSQANATRRIQPRCQRARPIAWPVAPMARPSQPDSLSLKSSQAAVESYFTMGTR